jgi:hypothetical protein
MMRQKLGESLDVKQMYKRFNYAEDGKYPILYASSIIQLYRDGISNGEEFEKEILNREVISPVIGNHKKSLMLMEKSFIQPKSIFIKLQYLILVANAIPSSFYKEIGVSYNTIIRTTLSIILYYLTLQTRDYGVKVMTSSQEKHLLGRKDYIVGITDLKKVCGQMERADFLRFLDYYSVDVCNVNDNTREQLYRLGEEVFILSIDEFAEYVVYRTEELYKKSCDEKTYSEYTRKKGFGFEELVFNALKICSGEIYHELYYHPNLKQKVELDIVIKDKSDLAVLECKSGTLNLNVVENDDGVKLKIRNITQKAFRSLYSLEDYLKKTETYVFSSRDKKITISGKCSTPILMSVSMYSMDFISSNIHTLFPDYMTNKANPILQISFEHLMAIALDTCRNGENMWDYFKQRRELIKAYPDMRFENNELDLYHEISNSNKHSMLAQLREKGLLEQISPQATVLGTYHDEFGNEYRPASKLLYNVDSFLLYRIVKTGKSDFSINNRFLRFFEEFIILNDN